MSREYHDDGTMGCGVFLILCLCLVSTCNSCNLRTDVNRLKSQVQDVTEEVEFLGAIEQEEE